MKSPQEPRAMPWASLPGCVCFLPCSCPPGMRANIAGGERWAQGICFSGLLSFFLHIFYPSPLGRDFFKTLQYVAKYVSLAGSQSVKE